MKNYDIIYKLAQCSRGDVESISLSTDECTKILTQIKELEEREHIIEYKDRPGYDPWAPVFVQDHNGKWHKIPEMGEG